MLEDWRNVDLNSITKQTLYTMEDSRDEHRKLIIQCKTFPPRAVPFGFYCLGVFFSNEGKEKHLGKYLSGFAPLSFPRDTLRLTVLVNGSVQMGAGN